MQRPRRARTFLIAHLANQTTKHASLDLIKAGPLRVKQKRFERRIMLDMRLRYQHSCYAHAAPAGKKRALMDEKKWLTDDDDDDDDNDGER